MKRFYLICLSAAILLPGIPSKADEGMWLVHAIDRELAKKMAATGLRLSPEDIYNENGMSLSDAIVSLDFGCTGSMISDKGLLITNHHCAYGDIYSVSTPENDYLENGFWAFSASEEIPIKNKKAYFLRKVVDVTEEVETLRESEKKAGRGYGSRRISHLIETKYSGDTGMEAFLSNMWSGEKYYLYLYQVYSDLRLVAAPPVSIAAFGGDVDNWEWPQHKGDFAIYRIYTAPDGSPAEYSENNVPLHPENILKISTEGFKSGDFTMVLGYPGSTDRYCSPESAKRKTITENPITCKLQGERMKIMDKWMNSSASIRLCYSDSYFNTSNVQELYEGESMNYHRFRIDGIKREEMSEMQEWVNGDQGRRNRWGRLADRLDSAYNSTDSLVEQRTYYREALVKGSKYYLLATRINNMLREAEKNGRDSVCFQDHGFAMNSSRKMYREMVPEVEMELFAYSTKEFLLNVDGQYRGDFINGISGSFLQNPEEGTRLLVTGSFLKDSTSFNMFTSQNRSVTEILADPLVRFYRSPEFSKINNEIRRREQKQGLAQGVIELEREYTIALHRMREDKGIPCYPDANSTMRLTYGKVGPLNPYDAVYCSESSTTAGILEKYDPGQYIYTLKPEFKELLTEAESKGGMIVNFITDNDITGGNSGSPILNSKGEIIGLAFDGNKESLAADIYFHPDYNKCVGVDIRYVLWIMKEYAGMDYLLEEIF